jgi:hypothetical protein
MCLHLSYNVAVRAASTRDEIPAIIGPATLIRAEGSPALQARWHISRRHDIYDIVHFTPAFFLWIICLSGRCRPCVKRCNKNFFNLLSIVASYALRATTGTSATLFNL